MATLNLNEILGDIQEAENKRIKQESERETKIDPRILKMKIGGVYTLKLIPNPKDRANSIVTYKERGFKSLADDKTFVYLGREYADAGIKNDPVQKVQWDAYEKAKAANDEAGMKDSYKLFGQRKQLINAQLIAVSGDDNYTDKVGEVFAFRYPAQENNKTKAPSSDIYKEIHEAIYGPKAAKLAKKVFLLSDKVEDFYAGKNLVVKVVDKGGFSNYAGTRFEDADENETPVTSEQLKKAFESVHDLKELVPQIKPVEEIKKALDEHFHCLSASPDDEIEEPEVGLGDDDDDNNDDDEIPGLENESVDKLLEGL